jgi:hypothetical protein
LKNKQIFIAPFFLATLVVLDKILSPEIKLKQMKKHPNEDPIRGEMAKLFIGILIIVMVFSGVASAQFAQVIDGDANQMRSPPDTLRAQVQVKENEKQADHLVLEWNESVERYLTYFRGPAKYTFQRWLDNAARSLPVMKTILRDENLPEDLVYLAMIESGFSPHALSRANAVGPWQLMPETARSYGLRNDLWRDERKDPIKSTRAAAQLLKDLYNQLDSWPLVLAAYNAGIGKVQRALSESGAEDFWDLRKSPYLKKETRNFVPKFMAAARIAKDPGLYGFRMRPAGPLRRDQIVLGESADLAVIASLTGSTYKTIKSLNPEINGRFTPPGDPLYVVNIPHGTKRVYLARSAAASQGLMRLGNSESFLPLLVGEVTNTITYSRNDICSFSGPAETPPSLPEETAPITAVALLQTPVTSKQKREVAQLLALCDL